MAISDTYYARKTAEICCFRRCIAKLIVVLKKGKNYTFNIYVIKQSHIKAGNKSDIGFPGM